MSNVDIAGQHLHWRPLQSVPYQIEKTDRNPCVDYVRTWHPGRGQTVFPGAGEERQRIAARQVWQERRSQFMGILSDACSTHERRAIVDQDAHREAC